MTPKPLSILVAVDFGAASARAVSLGGLIADRCGASTLRLLHAEAGESPAYFTHDQIEALERQQQAMRTQAAQFLTAFGRRQTGHAVSAAIDERPPSDAILHASATADLIVMGTHGRRGAARWWLGSVAGRVLREAQRPLLIVRDDVPHDITAALSRVIVHAAAPQAGHATLAYAGRLAACFSGDVIDGRGWPIERAASAPRATMLAIATPMARTAAWLSVYGEPLVRTSTMPILFVPETPEGDLP
jgi:nucleotide-binding universal stress UspA family protein